jgi:hypothetical protein
MSAGFPRLFSVSSRRQIDIALLAALLFFNVGKLYKRTHSDRRRFPASFLDKIRNL